LTETTVLHYDDARERDEAEARRLQECAAEPIRIIGRIQSHGILLAVDEQTGTIVAASDNAGAWLGRRVHELGSETLSWAASHAAAIDPVRAEIDGVTYDVIVHRGGSPLLIDLEPVHADLEYVRTGVVGAIQGLAAITDPDELRTRAAAEIKRITGFDRVMCYEFHDDGHGQVVADEREPDMEPYLGLHFPASDIPSQARALYLEKRSRVIVDTEDSGVAISSLLPEQAPLDIGATELRSASPHHLQFMRNMGQASTLSLALVADDRLVGMFTCAHRSPRKVPVLLRRALEVLASQVTMQLTAAHQIHELRRRLEARERRVAIVAPLYGRGDAAAVLLGGDRTVLDVVPADGVILRIGDSVVGLGTVPPYDTVLDIVDELAAERPMWEALPLERPELAVEMPGVAGLLDVPIGTEGDRLVFLRSEVARTVDWLGDQRADNRVDALSPRRSFSAWRESVTGRSLPWGEHAQDARELGFEIQAALVARAQAELAELALRDALTGLHNRRFLDDRLEALLAGVAPRLALIFLDLDDFKVVNDTRGHEVGDAVLAAVGNRRAGIARASDMVVRLGGDEFVIVCVGADEKDARHVAQRAIRAIGRPVAVADAVFSLSVSAGVVAAAPGMASSELLDAADAAMYRSKREGGGRVSA
jgi:chemotaxis family two-component system sensor kinase Cph1